MPRQIVFDTETTGLSPDNGDRIVEIGCVELKARRLTGRHLHLYLNPERDSDEGALRVHGLTTAFLSDKPKFAQVADEFLAFVQGAEIIIHNAAFDVGFVNAELARVGRPPFTDYVNGIVDTLSLAKELYPGRRNSLDALCDRLGVDNSGRQLHGALLDAELLADVYIGLTRGQNALLTDEHSTTSSHLQSGTSSGGIDLRTLHLPVLPPTPEELSAHEAMLVQLDQESKGKTVWRRMESATQAT